MSAVTLVLSVEVSRSMVPRGGDVAVLCAEATESAPEGQVHEPAD